MKCPPADQPPGQGTFYLQPPVGLAQPGQATGMAVDQCHNLPLHLCPQPVFRGNTKYASGSAEIFTHGWYRSPSGVLITKPQTPQAHTAGMRRIAVLSLSWIYCEVYYGKETAKLATMPRIYTPACTCCICPYGYPWWGCRTHPPRRTVIPHSSPR
ncbi:Uncharacterised protein [Escherichia coli]|nr:Uncharacterised protein [Escherichia coli]